MREMRMLRRLSVLQFRLRLRESPLTRRQAPFPSVDGSTKSGWPLGVMGVRRLRTAK